MWISPLRIKRVCGVPDLVHLYGTQAQCRVNSGPPLETLVRDWPGGESDGVHLAIACRDVTEARIRERMTGNAPRSISMVQIATLVLKDRLPLTAGPDYSRFFNFFISTLNTSF